MTFTTDNRFCVGASRGMIEHSIAAYGGRWIDYGPYIPADVVADRAGFAYDNANDVKPIILALTEQEISGADTDRGPENASAPTVFVSDDKRVWTYVRRSGGYIYVDAFLIGEQE